MKIAHISDVHLRTLKFHDEYRLVFENLYRKLEQLKPDLIVNTGDSGHTKTQISPEFVEMESDHIVRMAAIAPYHIILGNHDLNLMNMERQDAITPIVNSIKNNNVFLHKKSGLARVSEFDLNFWVFSLADPENYPKPEEWKNNPGINIGLFHGSVKNCVTDSDWRMTNTDHEISMFDGLDYVMMGDIHKQQFFNERKIAYAGSLIQQNFGEDPDKGFLLWDIADKNSHVVAPYFLEGNRKFYTIKLNDDLSFSDTEHVRKGSRIRVNPPRQLTLAEQKEIESIVKKNYDPYDVITLSPMNMGQQSLEVNTQQKTGFENLRQIGIQENLIVAFLDKRGVSATTKEKILEMNRRYQIVIDQTDDVTRNVKWKINKILWNNLFNYGEGNVIDFSKLGGVTGLFAPNSSGKSSLIDVILETLFDSTTRGIGKNIFLINDNKESAGMVADVTVNGQNYLIERKIERIKFGARKGESKEWGKTACGLYALDESGEKQSLIGQSRPETEKNIRQRVGSYEDLMLTSLSAQWNPLDIIGAKETKRKEIFFKFMDLDIFEQKHSLAKNESREYYSQLEKFNDEDLEKEISLSLSDISNFENLINVLNSDMEEKKKEIVTCDENIEKTVSLKVKLDDIESVSLLEEKELDVRKKIQTAEEKLVQQLSELQTIESEVTKRENLEQNFDLKFHEEKVKRIKELDLEIPLLSRTISAKEQQLNGNKKKSLLLQEVPCGNSFPSCKFLVDAFDANLKINPLADEVEGMTKSRETLQKEREDLTRFQEKFDAYNRFVGEKRFILGKRDNEKLSIENTKLLKDNLESQRKELLAKIEKCQKNAETLKKNEELESEILSTKQKKASLEKQIKKDQEKLLDLNRNLGSVQGNLQLIQEKRSKIQAVREMCTAYEHYMEAMGKDGIALDILAQKLPLINEEINKILMNVADFGVIIEHDAAEQSIRIYIQYGNYKPRLIELAGGAEKMLASISLRTALLSISSLPKMNMFIIDEGFGKLDPKNLENINKMFDYLRTVFDHVLVISHLDILKDMVDNMLEITADEFGYAHVAIGE